MGELGRISKLIEEVSPYYRKKKKPSEEHELVYDSSSETLEPVYFWILDNMNDGFDDVEKIVDNFSSSPGSGHFSEIGMKATRMQEEGMKILASVNTVLKSIMNLIYDLKEWEIRLSHYKASHSKNKEEAESAMLALKQIWMDNVDVKKGVGGINRMAQELQFVTLRDAFMMANSTADVDKMDLNDRVKRILKPRVREFFEWKDRSEKELTKRYEIERGYLRSQVSSMKLYTKWVRPYLIAAEKLSMKERDLRDPMMVNIFNTIVLELTLFGKSAMSPEQLALEKKIPKISVKRKYYKCVFIDFVFRGIPQRVSAQQAHYAFGGRVEVVFKGYCLNEDELLLLDKKLMETDFQDSLDLIEGTTTGSLSELTEDIEYFLKTDTEREKEDKAKKKAEDVNPFFSLFGFGEKKEVDEKEKKKRLEEKGVDKDSYAESVMRKVGEQLSAEACFTVFDIYKKSHGMESHPSPDRFGPSDSGSMKFKDIFK